MGLVLLFLCTHFPLISTEGSDLRRVSNGWATNDWWPFLVTLWSLVRFSHVSLVKQQLCSAQNQPFSSKRSRSSNRDIQSRTPWGEERSKKTLTWHIERPKPRSNTFLWLCSWDAVAAGIFSSAVFRVSFLNLDKAQLVCAGSWASDLRKTG